MAIYKSSVKCVKEIATFFYRSVSSLTGKNKKQNKVDIFELDTDIE